MDISFSELSASQRYHLTTQVVIPRPIAWVLTDNGAKQSFNLAPFSYFNAVCSDPPLVMLSMGSKPDGQVKDTRRNILDHKHLVIHIPHENQAADVTASAATLPHGHSEVEELGLALVEQAGWSLPRLECCKVAMLCEHHQLTELGPNKQAVFFCEIKRLYLDETAIQLDSKGRTKVMADQISPLGRLGANEYATFGNAFQVTRPR